MNALLARYLDGDLTDQEAAEFLDRLEQDPDLEAELRAHEDLLAAAARLTAPRAPEGFSAGVLRRVRAESAGTGRRLARPRWRREWLAAAAAVILAFGLGWRVSGARWSGAPLSGTPTTVPGLAVMPASWVGGEAEGAGWIAVRFVYAPPSAEVESVSVAGTFNDWQPSQIPMHREGGVWTAVVVLPRGSHEYMFVENGTHWVADPHAPMTRDDGFGGRNAVLDLRT